MVAITPQEVMDMKKERRAFEEMSDWEMKQLPRGLRLDIPMKSTQHLKRISPILRQLAEAIDRECRKPDLTPVQVLNHIWFHGQSCRRIIEEICQSSKKFRRRNDIA